MNPKTLLLAVLPVVTVAQNNQNFLDDVVNGIGSGFNALTSGAVGVFSDVTEGAVSVFSDVTEGAVSAASRISSDFNAGNKPSSTSTKTTSTGPTSSGESGSSPTSSTTEQESSRSNGAVTQAPYSGMAAFVAFVVVSQLI
ncbi:hypothetical protein GGI01_002335 [Coemansia sp. RSA 376]|nr:hypothetical protein GGH13_007882 [Coemansia sp. S155-1]KAJ2261363.1 hypothetical protein GGI01_002335 [Coemansia sp. RSA 376]